MRSHTLRVAAAIVPVLSLALTTFAVPSAWSAEATTSQVAAMATAEANPLPFDLPAASTLQASSRKVFAHYMPNFPVRLDNVDPAEDYYQRHYLNPGGEAGKFAAIGGHVRDRPMGRPSPGSSWRLQDLQHEVRQAIAGGLDGFAIDMMVFPPSTHHQVTTMRTMMKAAESVDPDFKIMLMLDMASSVPTLSKTRIAAFLAELGESPAAYRLGGKLVISAFYAEMASPAWYTQLFAVLRANHGISVSFHPTFLNEAAHRAEFAPLMSGSGIWGNRNPAGNDPGSTCLTCPVPRIKVVQALKGGAMKWMQPVSIQDARPKTSIFDEAQNTHNLRRTWQIARDGGADMVQLVTWNDYTEGTQFSPTARSGYAWLDLNSYYLTWYKRGTAPTIVRDTIYLTHRIQDTSARPSYPQTQLMKLRAGSNPARDTVEALTFLTAPGTVTVTVGSNTYSCLAPAGRGVCTVPLSPGTVSASVNRGASTVASVVSPNRVTARPYVQDFTYVAASSGRQGTSGAVSTRLSTAATKATGITSVSRYPILRYGSRGSFVKKVQKRFGLRQTGFYNKATKGKVKAFQQRRGWRATGNVGPLTWRALRIRG